ncbi:ELMO/CED-12 family protein [Metarhizium album ARSEF 1941]|uniref:ELMO/CED-12 family protein n=1 Tax=Metarhizium album (strain ARSEF 1941) TaxID=1081103 RepID=A0A0B2WJS7_METAS|nr:ELMO/CED-12 family protein [Metarhizium album ARSEF 1941]KHN96261.1 ELMO/CED-12 family protein [Metarhizium album ARSEF 1941]
MDQADVPALLARLSSDEDAARKMAVFKLQTSINDPSFADVFLSSGGLVVLRGLIMESGGNTLAYSLQSLTRLLEVDMGWDIFEGPSASAFVERIVELIVVNPLVNILRGAMSVLVALVGHSQSSPPASPNPSPVGPTPGSFGFRALKPAVAVYPQFFELVIQQLQSADHALCANALMLINALIRDSISNSSAYSNANDSAGSGGENWAKLVKCLQDLGLIKAVYQLMQSSSIQDLAHPAPEFQSLTKVLLRKWREVAVDLERPEHRRALKGIHLASAPERAVNGLSKDDAADGGKKDGRKHNPEKWRRLGFETESPAHEFDTAGYLGMMDLTDYVRTHEDGFQKLLLEQATRPPPERCPMARASLAVTMILYHHFEVDGVELEDSKGYQGLEGKDHDRLFRPLLLQWSRLHAAGLLGFLRIWKATGARSDDFEKVAELVRILVEQVVGQASRTRDILEVEDDFLEYDVARLRELQMELLELSFDETWGHHLYQVRETLRQEALQFVKEQRVRCLLQGSWFYKPASHKRDQQDAGDAKSVLPWRFAKLSHNRRYLHYADFDAQAAQDPGLDVLTNKIDLGTVSSVGSNVSATDDRRSHASGSTVQNLASHSKATTKITIYAGEINKHGEADEYPILTLWPTSHSLASEWLDGLLMLLNQAPITAETSKLINLVSEYGLKIRLLNVRMDSAFEGPPPGAGVVPSRAGLDEDYFFEV